MDKAMRKVELNAKSQNVDMAIAELIMAKTYEKALWLTQTQ